MLRKRTSTGHNVNDPSAGTQQGAIVEYKCTAIAEKNRKLLPATRVGVGDAIISILGDTIAGGTVKPMENDTLVFNGKTYLINAVASDPDDAMYECSCRG